MLVPCLLQENVTRLPVELAEDDGTTPKLWTGCGAMHRTATSAEPAIRRAPLMYFIFLFVLFVLFVRICIVGTIVCNDDGRELHESRRAREKSDGGFKAYVFNLPGSFRNSLFLPTKGIHDVM